MNLPQLPTDKANHAVYGAAIACVVSFYSPIIAGAVVVALAVLKEVSDAVLNYRATGDWKTGPHGVELNDALATILGGALVLAPQLVKL